jgi:hypothetical protein
MTTFRAGEERCDRCKTNHCEKCYHHTVCDTVSTAKVVEELEIMHSEYWAKLNKKIT